MGNLKGFQGGQQRGHEHGAQALAAARGDGTIDAWSASQVRALLGSVPRVSC